MFFIKGAKIPKFHSSGNLLSSQIFRKSLCRAPNNISPPCLISSAVMASLPRALLLANFLTVSLTSSNLGGPYSSLEYGVSPSSS
jgi:hypothetical protein